MAGIFDNKHFNEEVFLRYSETLPRVKQNALLSSGVLRTRGDLAAALAEQVGGNYIRVPMMGNVGGDVLNYDGATDITASGVGTYDQGMIVVGRAKAWQEKDFAFDITHHDFMAEIAKQTVNYWDDVDQATILSILKGVFGITAGNFAEKHTLDISGEGTPTVTAATLNNAIQKAAGANKNIFTLAVMHSAVATQLENLQLLEYFKQTDANGIQRPTNLAAWNGRTVLIDDDVPVGDDGETYTTYLLGQGAFDYADVGAKVPTETWRDPKTAGGMDMLIQRQRKLFAPYGISFVQPSTPIISPTNAELETAARWTLVKDTAGNGYIDHRAIPIARIISKG